MDQERLSLLIKDYSKVLIIAPRRSGKTHFLINHALEESKSCHISIVSLTRRYRRERFEEDKLLKPALDTGSIFLSDYSTLYGKELKDGVPRGPEGIQHGIRNSDLHCLTQLAIRTDLAEYDKLQESEFDHTQWMKSKFEEYGLRINLPKEMSQSKTIYLDECAFSNAEVINRILLLDNVTKFIAITSYLPPDEHDAINWKTTYLNKGFTIIEAPLLQTETREQEFTVYNV